MRLTGSFPYAQWPVLMPLDKPPGRSESPLGSERSFGFVPPPHPATVLSSDAGSVRSAHESIAYILSAGQAPPAQNAGAEEGFLTQRFSYQHTAEGHMVVTGISGAET